MGGSGLVRRCEQGEQLPLFAGSGLVEGAGLAVLFSFTLFFLVFFGERGSTGTMGLTGRGDWIVWQGFMVRRSEQGEQLPLLVGSRSNLVLVHTLFGLLGERQCGDSTHRDKGMGLGFSLFLERKV